MGEIDATFVASGRWEVVREDLRFPTPALVPSTAKAQQLDEHATSHSTRRAEMSALVAALRIGHSLTAAEAEVVLSFVYGLERGRLRGGRLITSATYKTHVNRICRKTDFPSLRALRDTLLRRFFGAET